MCTSIPEGWQLPHARVESVRLDVFEKDRRLRSNRRRESNKVASQKVRDTHNEYMESLVTRFKVILESARRMGCDVSAYQENMFDKNVFGRARFENTEQKPRRVLNRESAKRSREREKKREGHLLIAIAQLQVLKMDRLTDLQIAQGFEA